MVTSPNHPAAGKAGITSLLAIQHHLTGLPEPRRRAAFVRAMRTIATIIGDAFLATMLLIVGFGLHSLLGAPSWLMAVFVVPFLIYLHYRLGVSFRFIFCFVALFTLVSLAFAHFLPDQFRIYSGGLVVVLLSPSGPGFIEGRRPMTLSPNEPSPAERSVHSHGKKANSYQ